MRGWLVPIVTTALLGCLACTQTPVSNDEVYRTEEERTLNAALAMSGQDLSPRKRGIVLRMLSLNEDDLIRGLHSCVTLSGGQYPSRMDHKTVQQEARDWLIKKYGKKNDFTPDQRKQLEDEVLDRFFMATYYKKLIGDNEPAYYGKRVTFRNADSVLVRWNESEGKYKVVFGNLTTETVTAKRLAEIEKHASQ